MEEEERSRIEAAARNAANTENRIANLEVESRALKDGMKRIWQAVGAAGALIVVSIWDALKEVIFK